MDGPEIQSQRTKKAHLWIDPWLYSSHRRQVVHTEHLQVPARVLAVSNLRHILRATLSAIPGARSRRNVDRYVADSAGATSAAVHTGNVGVAAGRGRMYAARTRAEAFHDYM